MADYTSIADSEISEGQPVKSVTGLALRDNPIAIAEGATGAPRIVFGAMAAPVAGGAHIIWLSTTDGDEITQTPASGGYTYIAQLPPVRNAGTIRMSVESKRSDSGQVSFCGFFLNGTLQQEFTNASTSFVVRTLDVAVVQGDILQIGHRADDAGGPPISRRPRIYSDVNTILTF